MKKPANLKIKNNVDHKRTKAVSADYDTRKKKYSELKALRQELKQRKMQKEEQVKYVYFKKIGILKMNLNLNHF